MNTLRALLLALPTALAVSLTAVAEPPSATIRDGQLTAIISLPDAQKGYYRGTRFDWSGVISSLKYRGHDYITAADQPLARATLWGIRSVFALEPFINYDIAPGSEFSWTYTYQAYVLARKS